jgi:type 1 glutamine amidotransferase
MQLKSIVLVLLTTVLLSDSPKKGCQKTEVAKQKPLVVFVTGDHEYSSEETMPLIAAALEKNYNMRTVVLKAYPDHNAESDIPGLEILAEADLAVFYLRFRTLPEAQLQHIDQYLKSGKPVMGFRTTTHGFNFPKGHPSEVWNAFGERAFGSPPGWGKSGHTHYGHNSSTDVHVNPEQIDHPILRGVDTAFHVRSWLYHVVPDYPAAGSTALLMGTAVDPDKDAQVNPVAWTWKTATGGRSFMTTLGHPEDFNEEGLQRLVINAVQWCLGQEVRTDWPGNLNMRVPYRQ